jgi:putative hydroxymethylpyrimidine transport system substrate-binding protein
MILAKTKGEKEMKKSLLLLMCSLLLILGACSQGSNNASSSNKLKKVTVMLDWYPNAVHSFLYVAQEKGYFKKEGLDVQIQMPADSNDPLKLAAANKIDVALSYQPQVLMSRAENIPVQSFGAIVRHPLNALMVPKNGPVKSPKDLEGKTVGEAGLSTDDAIVDTMVKADGGDPSKVKKVNVNMDLMAAIATKQTDSIIGGYINHEELLLDKQGHPVTAFDPTKYGVPDYYELVFVAGEKALKQNKDMYKKFMTAAREGQKYVQEHPKEGLAILLKHENQSYKLDPSVETKSLQILLPLMDAKNKPFGYEDLSSWTKVEKWLYDTKSIKQKVNPADCFVNL